MMSKRVIFVSFLSVIVFAKAAENWSCETLNGTPCSGEMIMVSGVGRRDPFLNATQTVTCKDRPKQISKTNIRTATDVNDDEVSMESECLSIATPCITDFTLCIKDLNVPPVTLKCSYLKDFVLTMNEVSKCGADGAKENTHLMNIGNGTAMVKFSCERIRVTKPVTHTGHSRR